MKFKNFSFLQYLKSLFTKWFLYLGFIPYIYDVISTYLPTPLNSFRFPTWIINSSILISFLLANYFSWLELKEKLKTFLDNETNFKVKPLIYKLSATKYLSDIESKIKKYEEEIQILENIKKPNNTFGLLSLRNPFYLQPDKEDYLKWISEKKILKDKANSFISENGNLFLINFTISASRYDENIDIEIFINNSCEFIEFDKVELPIETSKSKSSIFNINVKNLIPPRVETEPFRRETSINSHLAVCNLRYLKKDFAYYFMNDYFFIRTNEDEINFKIHLNSKNSNGVKEYNIKIRTSEITEIKDLLEIKDIF